MRTDYISTSVDIDTTMEEDTTSSGLEKKIITCGVCEQEIPILHWTEHIGKEHNYLAWENGSTPLVNTYKIFQCGLDIIFQKYI